MWIPVLVALANILYHHFWTDLSWISPDGPSYFRSWEIWRSGGFDPFRTPLYPAFLGLVYGPFPDGCITPRLLVIAIQNVFYLVSVWLLTDLARNGLRLPKWATLLAMVPYCVPALFARYACNIATDGMATSLMVLTMWLVYRASVKFSALKLTGILVCTLGLLAIRPSLLFVPIALGLTVPLLRGREWRQFRKGLLITTACSFLAAGLYGYAFYRQTGHPGVSSVRWLNQVAMNVQAVREYDPEVYPCHYNAALSAVGEPMQANFTWYDFFDYCTYDPDVIYNELQAVYAANPGIKPKAVYESIVMNFRDEPLFKILPFWVAPLMAILYFPLLIVRIRRGEKQAWLCALSWLLFMGNFGVVILGTAYEYMRLIMPVYPMLALMSGDFAKFLVTGLKTYYGK